MFLEPQAFAIPYPPHVDLLPTQAGWSIWEPTALDWYILRGILPARGGRCPDSAEERLLEECLWAEEWV
jgi:hypothetical protein